jgi:hypothetical protein
MATWQETLILGDLADHENVFWVFVVSGLALGALVCKAAVDEDFRPKGWDRFPAASPPKGVLIGLFVAALMALIGYRGRFTVFHRMTIAAERVDLTYFYPERTVTLSPSDVGEVKVDTRGGRSIGPRFIVRIATRDGERYVSVAMESTKARALTSALNLWKDGHDFSFPLSEIRPSAVRPPR